MPSLPMGRLRLFFSDFRGGGTSFDNYLIDIVVHSLGRLNNNCDDNMAMYWEQDNKSIGLLFALLMGLMTTMMMMGEV